MTTPATPTDALAESQRLIATLEQLRGELPFADDILALHRPTHHELEISATRSEQAVAAWRGALARRWESEIAGRRLYKRIVRQLAEHYGGEDAPEVQLLSRGGAEADSSPSELLADLRRLQAALSVGPAFVRDRLHEVEQACAALESAITEANLSETQRRVAVLDSRMAREAYRRMRGETRRLLIEHYGEGMAREFAELLD
ncbi:MAG TPA: hypothetical protein VKE41_22480 [Roseiflexaceae bacterium]|nr:hypothetical protein [Roseiflexaceae bacterium]